VLEVAERESDAAALYAAVRAALEEPGGAGRTVTSLLRTALHEGWHERRENVFRCLGMIHPPQEVRRAHAAITRGSPAQRANALEWLEHAIGVNHFRRLVAVLEPGLQARPVAPVSALLGDGDAWIATLAEVLLHGAGQEMELIEKVFLLQQVDLLQGARSAHVALLAAIAEEMEVSAGTLLLSAGDVPDSMYVVTHGAVELHGVGGKMIVNAEQAFGTWALIDDQPSPVDASATEAAGLLRVTRVDFQDLLADHPEIGLGMLRGLAHRVRSLVA
jgi:hypothetical protein